MFFRVGLLFLGLACLGCAHLSTGKSFDGVRRLAEDTPPPLASAPPPGKTRFTVQKPAEMAPPPLPPLPSLTPAPSTAPALETNLPPLEPGPLPVISDTEWTIVPGLLRGQLEGWALRAGYQLIWKARHDYEMHSQAIFRENFADSVKRLFNRMHTHGNLLRVTIYEANRVIEVTED